VRVQSGKDCTGVCSLVKSERACTVWSRVYGRVEYWSRLYGRVQSGQE
jgi:hypothetical protein